MEEIKERIKRSSSSSSSASRSEVSIPQSSVVNLTEITEGHEKRLLQIESEYQNTYRKLSVRFKNDTKALKRELAESVNESVKKEAGDLRNDLLSKFQANSKELQTKTIEMLAVFVALFTFVSLDFSLLKNSINLGVSVSLILIAGGLLFAFVLLTHLVLSPRESKKNDNWNWWLLVFSLISTGIIFLGISLKIGQIGEEVKSNSINLEVNNKFKK